MTSNEWLSQYDATKDKFMWFIRKYFPKMEQLLDEARTAGNHVKMLDLLNAAWFELPDWRFNIIENPEGWNEFLFLLEEVVEA